MSSTERFSARAMYAAGAVTVLGSAALATSFLPLAPWAQEACRYAGPGLLFVSFLLFVLGRLIRAANKGPVRGCPDFKPWDHTG